MDEEAYKIMARIKYSTAYLSLDTEQKQLIKGYMNRYESLHGISGGVEQQLQPDNTASPVAG